MTITLYPAIVHDNSLSLDHGGSEVDEACEQINNATKGWGVSIGTTVACLPVPLKLKVSVLNIFIFFNLFRQINKK